LWRLHNCCSPWSGPRQPSLVSLSSLRDCDTQRVLSISCVSQFT
jgi:hypothetical protein